jgi:anti-sigma B factor antagonist
LPDPVAPLPETAFRCDVEPDRDIAYVIPTGELDIATAPIVDGRLAALRDEGFRRLVLDLRRLSFMDASGLRLIQTWNAQVRADGLGAFHVIPGPGLVQRLFTLTGMTNEIHFVDRHGAPSQMDGGGSVAFFAGGSSAGAPLTDRVVSLWGHALGRRRRPDAA